MTVCIKRVCYLELIYCYIYFWWRNRHFKASRYNHRSHYQKKKEKPLVELQELEDVTRLQGKKVTMHHVQWNPICFMIVYWGNLSITYDSLPQYVPVSNAFIPFCAIVINPIIFETWANCHVIISFTRISTKRSCSLVFNIVMNYTHILSMNYKTVCEKKILTALMKQEGIDFSIFFAFISMLN